jgi:hypothetical protein
MAALTKERQHRPSAQGTQRHRRRKVSNVKVFKGGLAAINALGHLVPASDAAGLICVGVFDETVDNTAGVAGAAWASYTTGIEIELDNAAGAIVQATLLAMVADDHSATTAAVAAHDVKIGPVVDFTATVCRVFIDEAANTTPSV